MSRRAFGEGERQQDAAIARGLYFFEKHWEERLKFSRRIQRQLERWRPGMAIRNSLWRFCTTLKRAITVQGQSLILHKLYFKYE